MYRDEMRIPAESCWGRWSSICKSNSFVEIREWDEIRGIRGILPPGEYVGREMPHQLNISTPVRMDRLEPLDISLFLSVL